ncbi:pyridoxine/pyridoxamine 5'-phosphate oxidase [Neptunicella marina]|uniref:Pyridoxal 5'-phosphate synthase n=1 Tax=Neptunicella marina TaxID=2125989 RepID=A0A8J6M1M5_9ALTE|nr:pyridoxal 5'-phosphate synthase [Neptunicella marina]MBC3765562.1 pyridoxal 5'-phosphate synthase [Neptunicella marina]
MSKTVTENPLEKFNHYWDKAKQHSPLSQKSAVNISTVDPQGFPQSRFVDLKEVHKQGLVFCTRFDSSKGKDIELNNKVALTAWWDHIGIQIRVSGVAHKTSVQASDQYWNSRSQSARVISILSKQSHVLDDPHALYEQVDNELASNPGRELARPDNWGGYLIEPVKVEFLTFKKSRLHVRELFTKTQQTWSYCLLHP